MAALIVAAAIGFASSLQDEVCFDFTSCEYSHDDWDKVYDYNVAVATYKTSRTDEEAWAHISGPSFFEAAGFSFEAVRPGFSEPNGVGQVRRILPPSPGRVVYDLVTGYKDKDYFTDIWFRACGAQTVPLQDALVQESAYINFTRVDFEHVRVEVTHKYCYRDAQTRDAFKPGFLANLGIVVRGSGSFFGSEPLENLQE